MKLNVLLFVAFFLLTGSIIAFPRNSVQQKKLLTWQMHEITLVAEKEYENPYKDVTCWIELTGPGFQKKVYGFWNGGKTFRVRIVATKPGKWSWVSSSNQPADNGLTNKSGDFIAVEPDSNDVAKNKNLHGFIRATSNGHALQYADGTPFFMVGDTWLAATTWRLPFRHSGTPSGYKPAPGIGFEDAVQFRKKQGFNSVSMIASYPNWESDTKPATYANEDGIYVRNAWEKFDYNVENGEPTAKNMRDEYGNLPFVLSREHEGVADFDRINPAYFESLDNKMEYLWEQGFVPLLETVRRDNCPAWKAYFDFNESYARYVQYLISRYGAFNIIFSGIHLDWIPKDYSLTADEFNEALTYHLEKYGPLPFGQPHTILINNSTYTQFGHAGDCPWLTMHSVGNKPRDHRVTDSLKVLFHLQPSYPAINLEPYYTGWDHEINMPGGERPPANSDRDNYFSRAMMYCSVLSGGLAGHVHGTAAYDITTTGEPEGMRPHFWEALKYESANYMQQLRNFILSEGAKYQELKLATNSVEPSKAPGSKAEGLDGWSYMMRTPEADFALLYFENKSVVTVLQGFNPEDSYQLFWFDPITGEWLQPDDVKSDSSGKIKIDGFPDNQNPAIRDWALKIVQE